MSEPKFAYLYNMNGIVSDRVQQLTQWLGRTQKDVLDIAIRDLWEREAAKHEAELINQKADSA